MGVGCERICGWAVVCSDSMGAMRFLDTKVMCFVDLVSARLAYRLSVRACVLSGIWPRFGRIAFVFPIRCFVSFLFRVCCFV